MILNLAHYQTFSGKSKQDQSLTTVIKCAHDMSEGTYILVNGNPTFLIEKNQTNW